MGVADLTGPTTTLAPPFPALRRGRLDTLQVNLGYRCNQSCSHCHVNAGPTRTETMAADTIALVPAALRAREIASLDLTGGAPELHPGFRDLVRQARALGVACVVLWVQGGKLGRDGSALSLQESGKISLSK